MEEDIYQLVLQLKLERVYIAGHDVGGSVGYAFARLHPKETRGAMILETPIPGLEPWEEIKADPKLWHIAFHQTPGLPEKLLAGRQFILFPRLFQSFSPQVRDVFEDAYNYMKSGQLLRQVVNKITEIDFNSLGRAAALW